MKCSARSELRWPAATPHQSAIRIQVPHARSGMMRGRAQMPRWLAPAWWMPLATPRRGRWWRANTSHNLMAGSWGGGAQAMFCPCKRAAHLSWIREVGLKSQRSRQPGFIIQPDWAPGPQPYKRFGFWKTKTSSCVFPGKWQPEASPAFSPENKESILGLGMGVMGLLDHNVRSNSWIVQLLKTVQISYPVSDQIQMQ